MPDNKDKGLMGVAVAAGLAAGMLFNMAGSDSGSSNATEIDVGKGAKITTQEAVRRFDGLCVQKDPKSDFILPIKTGSRKSPCGLYPGRWQRAGQITVLRPSVPGAQKPKRIICFRPACFQASEWCNCRIKTLPAPISSNAAAVWF